MTEQTEETMLAEIEATDLAGPGHAAFLLAEQEDRLTADAAWDEYQASLAREAAAQESAA